MRRFGRTVLIAATLMSLMHAMSLTRLAAAEEIRVLSVGAVQNAVRALAAQLARESGPQVVLTVASPVMALQKIKAGEVFDALISSEGTMDEFELNRPAQPETPVPLATLGLWVAVRA